MPPLPLAMLIPALIQGGSQMFGAWNQGRTNARNARRQEQFGQEARGWMQQGPSDLENQLLQLLTGGAGSLGQGFNTGQDSLMQMLNQGSVDTTSLFKSWEPIEQRALDNSLSNFWGSTTGLGERFGSAAATQTGKIRGEQAENNTARRAETSVKLAESGADRSVGIAQALMQAALNQQQNQYSGMGALLGAQNARGNMNAQLLSLIGGQGMGMQQASPIPGAMGDFSQLMMLLPMLQKLQGG